MRSATHWMALVLVCWAIESVLAQPPIVVPAETEGAVIPAQPYIEHAAPRLFSAPPVGRQPYGFLWEGFNAPVEYDIYGDRRRHRIQADRYGNRFGPGRMMMAPHSGGMMDQPIDRPAAKVIDSEGGELERLPEVGPERLPEVRDDTPPVLVAPPTEESQWETAPADIPRPLSVPKDTTPKDTRESTPRKSAPISEPTEAAAPESDSPKESPSVIPTPPSDAPTGPADASNPAVEEADLAPTPPALPDPPEPRLQLRPNELPPNDLPLNDPPQNKSGSPIRLNPDDLPRNEIPARSSAKPANSSRTLRALRQSIQ